MSNDQNNPHQYRVTVGDTTKVLKIEVGVPTRSVTISNAVNLNDVIGITTSNIQEGDILIADSDGILRNSQASVNKIDGKVFNRDSDRGFILIRRSADFGTPIGYRGGELAYSYLADPSAGGGGNGGDRLYFGVGSDGNELAERIDVIGGKYFTDLLIHTHGVTTPNTALLVDSVRAVDQLTIGDLTVNDAVTTDRLDADSATIGTLSVTSINISDLVANLVQVIREGEGINVAEDSSGKLVISAEFGTSTNAGVVFFDSDQFNVGDSGEVTLIVNDGGTF